ncbi:alpha/beta hydrolase [Niallia sp. Man26]|uniref:alpha/beta hydrolase n=1 Tax=unclassified Niallia TaxID=2837522 RepID=UPI001EDA6EA8|nr:alpha/beta hydrolase [Niallia sp. Man26]UPO90641.1 alpha/beta hydrolase [Niallia sp. Man26]
MTNKEIFDSYSIPFRLIEQQETADNLVIILPGAGYTTQAPLLHFTTSLFYTKGFDVLHINYSFSKQELSYLSEKYFTIEIQRTIDKAIENKKYKNIFVVAKSIGTIALSYLLHNKMLKDAKTIWLTPLLQRDDVFKAMVTSENKGLCIIGDKDSCFIAERFEKLKNNRQLTFHLVEGGNHSLELDGLPIESVEILKGVLMEISNFEI